ncbi:uncharacterized protein A1O9_00830 [Exophiala aquamarina CBS 119918]|uniref:Ubiquitin-like domain-containing protein n=1 Tax=Exophiala aquamarina CBS 119918 TaxID=1182545 RepID=A0A072PSZ9_9EURO|nr:uncharacterized protein A1O9_00830 [Exophiala aquamarina CBS 119918]KEF62857.1 hypothetical protein A1O9_00830 [Exophiala aquamarina CBS 119918]
MQIYTILVTSQSSINATPSLLLDSNIQFEDALGRKSPLPYQWFHHWESFEGLLRAEFKDVPGQLKVIEGEYHLIDSKKDGTLIKKDDWKKLVFPGSSITMSMIISQMRWQGALCPRPSCKQPKREILSKFAVITCEQCGLKYYPCQESMGSENPEFSSPEHGEIEEIELFRLVHINQTEDDVKTTNLLLLNSILANDKFDVDQSIYQRNIFDRFPSIPPYLALRLAEANAQRAKRLARAHDSGSRQGLPGQVEREQQFSEPVDVSDNAEPVTGGSKNQKLSVLVQQGTPVQPLNSIVNTPVTTDLLKIPMSVGSQSNSRRMSFDWAEKFAGLIDEEVSLLPQQGTPLQDSFNIATLLVMIDQLESFTLFGP